MGRQRHYIKGISHSETEEGLKPQSGSAVSSRFGKTQVLPSALWLFLGSQEQTEDTRIRKGLCCFGLLKKKTKPHLKPKAKT